MAWARQQQRWKETKRANCTPCPQSNLPEREKRNCTLRPLPERSLRGDRTPSGVGEGRRGSPVGRTRLAWLQCVHPSVVCVCVSVRVVCGVCPSVHGMGVWCVRAPSHRLRRDAPQRATHHHRPACHQPAQPAQPVQPAQPAQPASGGAASKAPEAERLAGVVVHPLSAMSVHIPTALPVPAALPLISVRNQAVHPRPTYLLSTVQRVGAGRHAHGGAKNGLELPLSQGMELAHVEIG